MILGATGTLGRAFARVCEARGIVYVALKRQDVDIGGSASVEAAIDAWHPWAVINAAGYVRVDDAEADTERCFRENVDGALNVATACARRGIPAVAFSSDLVFDGCTDAPYREASPVSPLSVYGASKAEAERRIAAAAPDTLIIRTSAFFGPWDAANFLTQVLNRLRSDEPVLVPEDGIVSPTYVPDLVNATLDLLLDGSRAVWHLANAGETSWADFARTAANAAAVAPRTLRVVSSEELRRPARRPAYSVLGTERGFVLPALDDALARYIASITRS